ncbi:MAG: ABC transporter ATP-binding protein, partial [Bacillota bacterium]
VVGLIGPNGAGKTTVFNMLTGIYTPTEGEIKYEDKVINGIKPHKISSMGIARTFQNIRLFSSLTVGDNVRISHTNKTDYNLAEAVLRLPRFFKAEAALDEKVNALLSLFNLYEKREEKARNLSYGEQRRLEIVRALATDPKLLLLDEPAAGMNADESQDLVDFVRQIKDRFHITVLMIEHHMDVVTNLCDSVTVLNFGKTIAEGTPAEIRTNRAVIDAYLGVEE